MGYKSWTRRDEKIVKNNYHDKTAREITEMLEIDRSMYAVHGKARDLGLSKNKATTNVKIKEAENNPIKWSSDIAYLTGLITADGTLVKDRPRIHFTTTDQELIDNVRQIVKEDITGKTYKPTKYKQGNGRKYQFTSRRYYNFLRDVGLTPNKSLTLANLDVPHGYFPSFFRGVFDGDGSARKDEVCMRIYSGSKKFLRWLRNQARKVFNVRSVNATRGDGAFSIEYWKEDTTKIVNKIYPSRYCLTRKMDILLGQI